MSFPTANEARNITLNSKHKFTPSSYYKKSKNLSDMENCKAAVLNAMHTGCSDYACSVLKKEDVNFFTSKGYKAKHCDHRLTDFPQVYTDISWYPDE